MKKRQEGLHIVWAVFRKIGNTPDTCYETIFQIPVMRRTTNNIAYLSALILCVPLC